MLPCAVHSMYITIGKLFDYQLYMDVYSVQMYTVKQRQKNSLSKRRTPQQCKSFLTIHTYNAFMHAHLQVYLTGTNSGALTQFVGVLAGSFLSVTIYTQIRT